VKAKLIYGHSTPNTLLPLKEPEAT